MSSKIKGMGWISEEQGDSEVRPSEMVANTPNRKAGREWVYIMGCEKDAKSACGGSLGNAWVAPRLRWRGRRDVAISHLWQRCRKGS